MLKKKNYIYTDLKPENILINMNDKKGSAFLINMDNVVTLKKKKMNQICSITDEFFPPVEFYDNKHKTSMINSYLKTNKNQPDHLLIWTYCATLMSLVCPDFEKKRDSHFKNRIVHENLALSNQLSMIKLFINCDKNIKFSGKLKVLLDKCLISNTKIKKFENLLNEDWFDE